jgi:hypothetical protein
MAAFHLTTDGGNMTRDYDSLLFLLYCEVQGMRRDISHDTTGRARLHCEFFHKLFDIVQKKVLQ